MMTTFSAALPDPSPDRRPINWTMVAVAVSLTVHTVGLISWLAVLDHRVKVQEQAVPPGAVARLETQVDDIKTSVKRIEDRLYAGRS